MRIVNNICLVTALAASSVSAFQSPIAINHDIDSFLDSHVIGTEDIKNLDASLVAAWKELLVEYGPSRLVNEIKNYKIRASSFPGTTQEFREPSLAEELASTLNSIHNNHSPESAQNGYEVVSMREKFKNHSLRVREGHPELLHLDSVKQHTGYLDIEDEDKHLFYWFFELRNDPANDPIILWLNGGPGCSSSTGLFFELGPSLISEEIYPVYNPYSWNLNASVIFLDQPVGVGYSHLSKKISTTAAAGKDVYAFLELFFKKFPQFNSPSTKFHIAGELYGGHYVPKFASEIINQKDRTFELSSILVGNGITDALIQLDSQRSMLCGEGGIDQMATDEECAEMADQYEKCVPFAKLCYNLQNPFACVPATLICSRIGDKVKSVPPFNPYDIRKPCEGDSGLCYEGLDYSAKFLNSEFVKMVLGVDSEVQEFQPCSNDVGYAFALQGDMMLPHQQYVAELLEAGVPVLLYAGDKDYICNWVGNNKWSAALPYSGHEFFELAPFKPFITGSNSTSGEVKNYDIFTFLRVYDAGHMVPYDKPEVSLEMLNRWLAGDYAFTGKK